jgi:o-succinylbenzoate synthase
MRLTVWRVHLPLHTPYKLSFATLDGFDCLYVRVEGDGRVGYGEITPLPGYSAETIDAALHEVERAGAALADGETPDCVIDAIEHRAPMTASGLACAFESWRAVAPGLYAGAVNFTIPLAALCQGDSPGRAAETARRLVADGYTTLKLKVGVAPLAEDLKRIEAVAAVVSNGIALRLDANQALDSGSAHALCRAVETLPVALLEQPFEPGAWTQFEALAQATTVPLMLDESIWSEADVRRAAASGARLVKLKLCKHSGLAHTVCVAAEALRNGLGVVLGNGVQSALGNHLEARLYAELGLSEAAEINGFLKLASPLPRHRMRVERGRLYDGGLHDIGADLCALTPHGDWMFKN